MIGDDVAVSSTKGSTGHLLGAAGAIEAIFTILAVHHDIMPPTLNLENLESDEFQMDHVRDIGRAVENVPRRCGDGNGIQVALTNSFGFGGTNASLCFKKIGSI